MRIVVAAVGRLGPARAGAPEAALFKHYADRLTPPPLVREVTLKRALSGVAAVGAEAKLLLDAVPKGARMVALDAKGKALSSEALAGRLRGWRDDGVRQVAFLIGGADGLDASVLARADLVLSLGSMTWPHLLVRGMLAEQLYRAQCINAGHPYHRG